jgi:hypothetical protein
VVSLDVTNRWLGMDWRAVCQILRRTPTPTKVERSFQKVTIAARVLVWPTAEAGTAVVGRGQLAVGNLTTASMALSAGRNTTAQTPRWRSEGDLAQPDVVVRAIGRGECLELEAMLSHQRCCHPAGPQMMHAVWGGCCCVELQISNVCSSPSVRI